MEIKFQLQDKLVIIGTETVFTSLLAACSLAGERLLIRSQANKQRKISEPSANEQRINQGKGKVMQ